MCNFISEHEPRKGTETVARDLHAASEFVISEHEPRKGTETKPLNGIGIAVTHFRTRTPKGDGNKTHILNHRRNPCISEHEPRKGTETAFSVERSTSLDSYFRTRTPKGDGNFSEPSSCTRSKVLFQNTNPERGRKLAGILSLKAVSLLFQNTNPERGRKLPRLCSHNVRKPNFRTRTPKGDGNFSSLLPNPYLVYIFQNVNPERGRKHLVNLAVQADLLEHFRM